MANTHPMQFTLGDALRKARTEAEGGRISQEKMAEALHVSRPTVSAWENGDSLPTFPQVVAWSKATGWPLDWFVETVASTTPLIHAATSSVQLTLLSHAA